jgi:cytochrome c556
MNNMEKALAFDYLYYKLREEAAQAKINFFHPKIFLTMLSSLVYRLLKKDKDPFSANAYESTMNEALAKIKRLQDWFEKGQPPDDNNVIDEIVDTMNENQERTAPMLDFIQKLVAMKQGGNGGNSRPEAPKL